MSATRRLLPFALAALVCGCAGQSGPGDEQPSPSPSATATPLAVTVRSQGNAKSGVRLSLQRGGRRIYAIVADSNVSRRIEAGAGESVFVNPSVTFFQTGGRTLVARSPQATVHERARTVVMTGGVHARSSTGVELLSRTLTYDERTQMLHGEGDVVMTTRRGERLEGQQIDADTQFSRVRILGDHPAPSGAGRREETAAPPSPGPSK